MKFHQNYKCFDHYQTEFALRKSNWENCDFKEICLCWPAMIIEMIVFIS
jgi:hypothetical protein